MIMTTNTQTSLKLGNRRTALAELLVVDQLLRLIAAGRLHSHLIRVTERNKTGDEVSLRGVDRLGDIASIEALHDQRGQTMSLTRQNKLLHGEDGLLDTPLLTIRGDSGDYASRVVLRGPALVRATLQQAAHHRTANSTLADEQIVRLHHLVDLVFQALTLEKLSPLRSEIHRV